MFSKVKIYLPIYILFFTITLFAFFPSIKGNFFYDDKFNILQNDYIQNANELYKVFTSSATASSSQLDNNYYRPIKSLNYFFLYQLFGENPLPFHINNILIHSLCAFVFFLNFRLLNIPKLLSFLLACIHCVHPAFSMNVAYISGIADPLCLLFISLSFHYFLKYLTNNNPSPKQLLISCLWYIPALFSKENSISYGVFIFLLICIFKVKNTKWKINKNILYYGVVIIIFTTTFYTLKMTIWDFTGNGGLVQGKNVFTENIFVRLNTFIHCIINYISVFYFPNELAWSKSTPVMLVFNIITGTIGLLVLILSTLSIYISRSKTLLISLIWVISFIAPFTLIVPLNSRFLDHWLYPLSFGIILITYKLISTLLKKPLFIKITISCFILALSLKSFSHSKIFSNDILFFENEKKVGFHPNNSQYLIKKKCEALFEPVKDSSKSNNSDKDFMYIYDELSYLIDTFEDKGILQFATMIKNNDPLIAGMLYESVYRRSPNPNIKRVTLEYLTNLSSKVKHNRHRNYFYYLYVNLMHTQGYEYHDIRTIVNAETTAYWNNKQISKLKELVL